MGHVGCLGCNFNANRLESKQHNPDETWLCSLASRWRGNKSFLGCAPIHRCGREDVTFLAHHIVCGFWCGARRKGIALPLTIRFQCPEFPWCFCCSWPQVDTKKHEASLNPRSLVYAGYRGCFLQLCCQWKWLTPGLQPLFFALPRNHWAVGTLIVLYQEETNYVDVTVLFIRHYRLHIFNELKLLVHIVQTTVNQDKSVAMTFSNSLQLPSKRFDSIS